MKKLALLGLGVSAFIAAMAVPASAAPIAPAAALGQDTAALIQVRHGGHHYGHMHRGGRGHHYGWHRGRGHHYGWSRGRHHHR